MPRQDVPYGGAICRLRERIAEIWDELGKKLHSINGVEGDGQGNVLIRSDNAALTITDNQVQHEIVLDLDTSQLPAADVNSVNGQTGVVALTADDIPSDNGDVQTDLDNLEAADTTLQGNINAEALARQNADSTLQTNINTISAGLPAAAAAAVAADPTIAQLVTDLAGKVDLTDVSTVETPNTIAKRNGSGRLVAADPASGATDKTLVTANWVSQTGNTAPNNLLHKSGNESSSGIKTFNDIRARTPNLDSTTTPINQQSNRSLAIVDMNGNAICIFRMYHETNGNMELSLIIPKEGWDGTQDYRQPRLRLTTRPDGTGVLAFFNGTTTIPIA